MELEPRIVGHQDRLFAPFAVATGNCIVVKPSSEDPLSQIKIVELAEVEDLYARTMHPYTQALLSAVPQVEDEGRREVIRLEGDMPSPANPPSGCHFHPRCPRAQPACRDAYPELRTLSPSHQVSCRLVV